MRYLTLSLAFHLVVLPLCKVSALYGPVQIDPSEYWDGNDGPWSSFAIQVGQPPQEVRVMASTAESQTWAILPQGCPEFFPVDCNHTRGYLFNPDNSSSWKQIQMYDLHVEENLGYNDSNQGLYGLDTITLGWPKVPSPIAVSNQIIAGIATKQYWLGMLGVHYKETNLTNVTQTFPSLLTSLKTLNLTSSLSYGYTAGARYQAKGALGSLTLGGYDLSRSNPTNLSVILAPDNSRDLVVAIKSITTSGDGGYPLSLMQQPILAYIDSTIPHIWLPNDTCKAFEQAFGLTLDATTGLYLLNDSQHQDLMTRNPSVNLTLADDMDNDTTIVISLPYAAFDLEVSYPIVNTTTRYFPLRQAANDTQYTLGRTFLQAAYLTVDFERSKFYVAQARFAQDAPTQLVPIGPPGIDIQPHRNSRLYLYLIPVYLVGVLFFVAAYFIWRHPRKFLFKKLAQTSDTNSRTSDEDRVQLDTFSLDPQVADLMAQVSRARPSHSPKFSGHRWF